MTGNAEWFEKVREVVWELVNKSDGAILMTRDELSQVVIEALKDVKGECPPTILWHITNGLQRKSLASCAYRYPDGSILVIHNVWIEAEEAKKMCEERGLSDAVKVALEKESVTA